MVKNIEKGNLDFTGDYIKGFKDSEVIIIAVGTLNFQMDPQILYISRQWQNQLLNMLIMM